MTFAPELAVGFVVSTTIDTFVERAATSSEPDTRIPALDRLKHHRDAILKLASGLSNAERGISEIMLDLKRLQKMLELRDFDHARVAEQGRHNHLAIEQLTHRIAALEAQSGIDFIVDFHGTTRRPVPA
jgi:hypothetical protein